MAEKAAARRRFYTEGRAANNSGDGGWIPWGGNTPWEWNSAESAARSQQAPRLRITAGTVAIRILVSVQNDRFSAYQASKRTRSS